MFIRNAWYVAAWSREVTAKLLERVILGESVMLYRASDGKLVGMENRCPHRNMPLSQGRLLGDRVQCIYHGLQFDSSGRCVHIPGEEGAAVQRWGAKPLVRTYPLAEKHGWIFIWMGEPERADPRLIPNFHAKLEDGEWESANGLSHLKCGYRLILDNLLDLSHVAYVHSSTNGNPEVAEKAQVDTKESESSVRVTRIMRDVPPAPAFAQIAKYRANIDRWQVTNFYPPAYIYIINGSRSASANSSLDDVLDSIGHWGFEVYWALTPETESSTHGFWVSTYRKADVFGEMAQKFSTNTAEIIAEDVFIYEAQQRAIELAANGPDRDVAPRITIKADRGLVHARKIIQKLSSAEQNTSVSA